MQQHRHIGVYALLCIDLEALLIRKARGPYSGQLDLPGGGIEFGETPETALARELLEETGLRFSGCRLLFAASNLVRYTTAAGIEEELHHLGLIYAITLEAEIIQIKQEADGEDSAGALWLQRRNIPGTLLSPFADAALKNAGWVSDSR